LACIALGRVEDTPDGQRWAEGAKSSTTPKKSGKIKLKEQADHTSPKEREYRQVGFGNVRKKLKLQREWHSRLEGRTPPLSCAAATKRVGRKRFWTHGREGEWRELCWLSARGSRCLQNVWKRVRKSRLPGGLGVDAGADVTPAG